MDDRHKQIRFEALFISHLDAAYNLARQLTRNAHDAEDVVQDSYLRAFKYFDSYRGGNSRSWLLAIVRNTCFSWLQKNRSQRTTEFLDEEMQQVEDATANPEVAQVREANHQVVQEAIGELPLEFREVTVLREMEGLSYREIADIVGVPIGTVMSRLSRARKQLQRSLVQRLRPGGTT